ncbi:NADPH:quinone reductase [Vibrio xiamenensis]|uniref:NADPH:quinone reductase n=1 Tax=Vibrio xiamenensis TaxID=861298 RepID=A0A1G7XGY6_9VIBR|nr:zinc-binding alcohol dehydrogenase family protein [Vibrio xiamenensis]SDG83387.1 NADPH:quinone reductase [Vibrio xiamenensis]
MKALVAKQFGTQPVLQIEDRSIPQVKPGFTLVKMHAATVNPLSNQIRLGGVPAARAPLILSNDGSGIVVESDQFKQDIPVAIYGGGALGITEDGLQQEYALVENKWVVELPVDTDLNVAAALPINYVSAYQAISRVGQLKKGKTVLISGATGSLGHALIQLVNALGATPIGVVSTSRKIANALESGAKHVVDLSSQDMISTVMDLTEGQGVDLAFDTVAGQVLGQLMKCLKTRGAVVSIGFAGGFTSEIDIVDVVVYEKKLLGFDAHLETDEDVEQVFEVLKVLLENGKIKPRIDSVFPLEEYDEAYQHLISRKAQGTILLQLNIS